MWSGFAPGLRWSIGRAHFHWQRLRKPRPPRLSVYVLVFFLFCGAGSLISLSSGVWRSSPQGDVNIGASAPSALHKDKKPVVNPHNFHLMIGNPRLCADKEKVALLIMVTSSAQNFERRDAIRETWGGRDALSRHHAALLFLLANPSNSGIQRKIVEEYRTFGDTIQEDFAESYLNLTLKTVMGVKWASKSCSKATFVMKTDDDIFVNVPYLMTYLGGLGEEGALVTGCIKQRNSFRPVNADPDAFLPPAHPLFAAGAGYVFSGELLPGLLDASLRTRIVPVEDVYVTGHLARALGVHPPRHDDRFSCGEMVRRDCDMAKIFTGHKITPDRMRSLWSMFENGIKLSCG